MSDGSATNRLGAGKRTMLLVASAWPREISNDLCKFHADG